MIDPLIRVLFLNESVDQSRGLAAWNNEVRARFCQLGLFEDVLNVRQYVTFAEKGVAQVRQIIVYKIKG